MGIKKAYAHVATFITKMQIMFPDFWKNDDEETTDMRLAVWMQELCQFNEFHLEHARTQIIRSGAKFCPSLPEVVSIAKSLKDSQEFYNAKKHYLVRKDPSYMQFKSMIANKFSKEIADKHCIHDRMNRIECMEFMRKNNAGYANIVCKLLK